MMNLSDTICAPATSVGTGAISIIRVSGPRCLEIVDAAVCFVKGTASSSKGYTLKRGSVQALPEAGSSRFGETAARGEAASGNCEVAGNGEKEFVDDVLVAIFRAPHSYTGEDSAEIYCHASTYIVGRILGILGQCGCRSAEPGEFTRRAFVNGKMDLAQAEAVADVISSTSSAQHRVAANQLRGGYSKEIANIREELLELTSLMELELDFSDEDVEFADRSRLRQLLDDAIARCTKLADSFRLGNALRSGVPVAIAGAPNSGKSTLLNALLGDDRAIVTDIPGTTRDTIEETFVLGGILFRFIDTAGIRDSSDTVERLGIERTYKKISQADIVLGVIDMSSEDVGKEVVKISSLVDPQHQKLLVLCNKIDTFSKPANGSEYDFYDSFACLETANKNVIAINNIVSSLKGKEYTFECLPLSAKTGLGMDTLRSKLVSLSDIDSVSDMLVTNARHAEALRAASSSLQAVRDGLGMEGEIAGEIADASIGDSVGSMAASCQNVTVPTEFLSEDLRAALAFLGSITGQITSDEVLGNIFKKFCIGK